MIQIKSKCVSKCSGIVYLINFHVDSSKVDASLLKGVILFLVPGSLKAKIVSQIAV